MSEGESFNSFCHTFKVCLFDNERSRCHVTAVYYPAKHFINML